MIIRAKGLTVADIESAVRSVNQGYEFKFGTVLLGRNSVRGAVTVQSKVVRVARNDSITMSVKIGAATRSPGARLSASGRGGPWACWFTFRDVLDELYVMHEDATVRTALATYKGVEDFREKFPATYYTPDRPYDFGALCYDLGYHDQHDR